MPWRQPSRKRNFVSAGNVTHSNKAPPHVSQLMDREGDRDFTEVLECQERSIGKALLDLYDSED